MHLSSIEEKLKPLLAELNIGSLEEIVKDYLFTEILYRISKFEEEMQYFQKKYQKSFEEFKKEYESSEENFTAYDDLMAWEFAIEGYNYWKQKLEELKSVLQNS
ncbi:hypothetical protein [Thermodesulfatator atlanticus]|uniref:hypothetical protein n=1 Tax=Thermodesulfatator atlanticus TaxID=501497 RepID=UPI0003B414E4|nr:hypothetical protein [Thermodesulfatator atlanticus]